MITINLILCFICIINGHTVGAIIFGGIALGIAPILIASAFGGTSTGPKEEKINKGELYLGLSSYNTLPLKIFLNEKGNEIEVVYINTNPDELDYTIVIIRPKTYSVYFKIKTEYKDQCVELDPNQVRELIEKLESNTKVENKKEKTISNSYTNCNFNNSQDLYVRCPSCDTITPFVKDKQVHSFCKHCGAKL